VYASPAHLMHSSAMARYSAAVFMESPPIPNCNFDVQCVEAVTAEKLSKAVGTADDIEAINRKYLGRSEAERYRLAQAFRLARLYCPMNSSPRMKAPASWDEEPGLLRVVGRVCSAR
jgi:hypothetical protein